MLHRNSVDVIALLIYYLCFQSVRSSDVSFLPISASVCSDDSTSTGSSADYKIPVEPMPKNFKVAFIGDTGTNIRSRRLMRFLKDRVDAVVHAGDMSYELGGSGTFIDQVEEIFGKDFPYFATLGDHDLYEAYSYKQFFDRRLALQPNVHCRGKWGVAQVCTYQGIVLLMMGISFKRANYAKFIEKELDRHKEWPWKVCVWHRTSMLFQPGHKQDDMNPMYYDLCRRHGAFIISGHEHEYARTHTMTTFLTPNKNSVLSDPEGSLVHVGKGTSFAVVTGMGGEDSRKWNPNRIREPWWAAVASAQNLKAAHQDIGALICEFHVNGDLRQADCQFRNTQITMDQFKAISVIEDDHISEQDELSSYSSAFSEFSYSSCSSRYSLSASVMKSMEAKSRELLSLFKETFLFGMIFGTRSQWRTIAEDNFIKTKYESVKRKDVSLDLLIHLNYQSYQLSLEATPTSSAFQFRNVLGALDGKFIQTAYIVLPGYPLKEGSVIGSDLTFTIYTSEFEKITWVLNINDMMEGGSKVVWISPDISSLLNKYDQPYEERINLNILPSSQTGYDFLQNVFRKEARVSPYLSIELVPYSSKMMAGAIGKPN